MLLTSSWHSSAPTMLETFIITLYNGKELLKLYLYKYTFSKNKAITFILSLCIFLFHKWRHCGNVTSDILTGFL
jgi:hypothetical protein